MSDVFDFYSLRKTSMLVFLGNRITLVNAAERHDVYYAVRL